MKIISREEWNDGTLVQWEVAVHEVDVDLEGWYDRDAETNGERIKKGAVIREFVVDEVFVTPDADKSNDEEESIAGGAFEGVAVGGHLVVFMNHKEYCEKLYGKVANDFSPWPTLISLQDCGFNVEVVEEVK